LGSIGQLKYKQYKPKSGTFDKDKFLQEFKDTYESKAGFTQKKTFAPSTIGYGHGKCARYWYLAFNGAEFEDTADYKGKANMENGTFVHDRLQSRLSKMNKSYKVIDHEAEILVEDPPIRGFRDTLILDVENNIEIPFEIKSMKDDKFVYKQSSQKPEENHMIQLLIYMYTKGHDTGVFFYENKNDQEPLLIVIEMDEQNKKLVEYVLDWLRGVYKLYEEKTLPSRAGESKTRMPCSYCPVKKTCWKEMKLDIGDVDYPMMETTI